jgi:release factor glutamine methyltransferase
VVASAGELRNLLAEAVEALRQASVESAALDAELLLAAAAGVDRARLLTGSISLDSGSVGRFRRMIARRAAREPLAYILEHKEFYGLDFEVSGDVLIPRPETELVVETALEVVHEQPDARVLDLGTGSGAIAIAIAVNAPAAQIAGVDISAAALELARGNARRHRCEARIDFYLGDLFAALPCSHQKYDLIVSNPPYVREDEMAALQPEIARYEPHLALFGGQDGLDFYRRIAAGTASHLNTGGEVIVELGAGQQADIVSIMHAAGLHIVQVLRDLAGHHRVLHARLPG